MYEIAPFQSVGLKQRHWNDVTFCCSLSAFRRLISLFLPCCTHHYRPQHGYEAAEPLPVLYESLPQGLLLCLFQQNVFIADILHGAVQLGLDITTTLETKWTHKKRIYTSLQGKHTREHDLSIYYFTAY